jgi:hypothetical protein
MKSYDRVDQAIDSVLKASGSALRHYTMQKSIDDMRAAMRTIMSEAYMQGVADYQDASKLWENQP